MASDSRKRKASRHLPNPLWIFSIQETSNLLLLAMLELETSKQSYFSIEDKKANKNILTGWRLTGNIKTWVQSQKHENTLWLFK